METKDYKYWEDEGKFVGYLIEYPDYTRSEKKIKFGTV
jgi:hypothetical protein